MASTAGASVEEQDFDYFLVLDFEATCIKDMRINPQEIIEFPCLLVNSRTFEVEARFHRYVKPVYRPKLSPFCIKLTGKCKKDYYLSHCTGTC